MISSNLASRARWAFAALVLIVGGGLLVVSNMSSFAQSCETVTRLDEVPPVIRDITNQQAGQLGLPSTLR